VGAGAYAARLEARARRFTLVRSELQTGTNRILRLVTWVMVPAGAGLVASQLLRAGQGLADALRGSVAGVGAMVPEGLVLLTSVAFAVGALRLARRRVLVQELAALEGLARVDVLCIDKTGTLTAPGMHLLAVEPVGDRGQAEVRAVIGAVAGAEPAANATASALMAACPETPGWVVTGTLAFSSARKWSAVSFAGQGTWVLGAPDVLDVVLPPRTGEALAQHQGAGRRVLLLARLRDGIRAEDLTSQSVRDADPVALLVLAEELRPEAAPTIGYLLGQGVTVKVLSGDAAATVGSVAARVGIAALGPPRDAAAVGDGEDDMAALFDRTNVLGRVRPEQKLAAVRALQKRGHVVAMVGDGVNDVQALKQADLGIAMGSGSQSCRSVARIVLLDSSFAAVPLVLDEGRRVIANIERVANLFVTKTVYAAWLAVLLAGAGVPYPFFPRHLTIVSTCTIGVPGFFLALAAGAPRAQPDFTRRVLRFCAPAGTVAAVATLAVYGIARVMPSVTATQARTAAMLELFAVALWVLGRIARPLEPARLGLLLAMAACIPVLFAVPLSRRVFALALPPATLLTIAAVVAAGAVLVLAGVWWRARALAPPSPPAGALGHHHRPSASSRPRDRGAPPPTGMHDPRRRGALHG
jgi:cation-transporting ATPase E